MLKHDRSEPDQKNLLEKGFTLVELLIVIVILGILAGIVVFAVGNLTSNAKTNACATEKSSVQAAAEAYKAYTGNYPSGASAAARMTTLTSTSGAAGQLLKTTPPSYELSTNTGDVTAISGNSAGCL